MLPKSFNYSIKNQEDLILAYAKFYDLRAGTIEIEFKEDKQGLGMAKRSKKRYEAQQMVMLLNNLAHNILVWFKGWLGESSSSFQNYGLLRFRRDILHISGFIEILENAEVARIILNKNAPKSIELANALNKILIPTKISVLTGQTHHKL